MTPVRAALNPASPLVGLVKDGLRAMRDQDKALVDASVRGEFADSLDVDEALRAGKDRENRWDYLLGHEPSARVIALEPHSAETGEISTVIRKRKAAREQLRSHLRSAASVHAWCWVASDRVAFVPHEKAMNRLNQEGIQFVGSKLLPKRLPTGRSASATPPSVRKGKKRGG